MIINVLDGYYFVFDSKNWNTELDKTNITIKNYYVDSHKFIFYLANDYQCLRWLLLCF